jgi:hypothetical protein
MLPSKQEPQDEKTQILLYFFRNIAKSHDLLDRKNGGFKEEALQNPLVKSAYGILEDRLNNGWKILDIVTRLQDLKTLGCRTKKLQEVIPLHPPLSSNENTNLLLNNEKYTSMVLKEIVYPIYSLETGKLIKEGSVSRKKEFSLGDLIDFYLSVLSPKRVSRETIKRILKYILDDGTHLDILIRAIELWGYSTEKTRGEDPWLLSRMYITEAIKEKEDSNNLYSDESTEEVSEH